MALMTIVPKCVYFSHSSFSSFDSSLPSFSKENTIQAQAMLSSGNSGLGGAVDYDDGAQSHRAHGTFKAHYSSRTLSRHRRLVYNCIWKVPSVKVISCVSASEDTSAAAAAAARQKIKPIEE
jgi:hypothetical protein